MLLLKKLINRFGITEKEMFLRKLNIQYKQVKSDQQLYGLLQYLYQKRYFIDQSPRLETLVSSMERHIIKNKKTPIFYIQAYNKLKEIDLLTPSFMYGFLQKIYKTVSQEQQIRNQNLEKYLWLLLVEGPYDPLFSQAAELHTLRLFEMQEYMNSIDLLPTWEPYIRIAYMLKQLGHKCQIHKNLTTNSTINKIDFKYFPYLSGLLTVESSRAYKQKYKMDVPLVTRLIEGYLQQTGLQFNHHLRRMEQASLPTVDQKDLDVITWGHFCEALEMFMRNEQFHGQNSDFDSQLKELFERLTESYDLDLLTITRISSAFTNNKKYMSSRRYQMMKRLTQSLLNKHLDEYAYFPINGYLSLLENCQFITEDKGTKKYVEKFLVQKAMNKHVCYEGEKQEFMKIIVDRKYQGYQKYVKQNQK